MSKATKTTLPKTKTPVRLLLVLLLVSLVLNLLSTGTTFSAGIYSLSVPKTIIGVNRTHRIASDNDTLLDVARDYGIGYNAIVDANQLIDPWLPNAGDEVMIPGRWILPEPTFNGIIINLAELRLYYYYKKDNISFLQTYPIGIGVEGYETPLGSYKILGKVKHPVWTVPKHILAEYDDLPATVPHGPDNPLGDYWLQLSVPGYGIHGTQKPLGVGRRVSSGCIRLYPEDIEMLYRYVEPGTTVRIIREPVKVALSDGEIYLEIHKGDLSQETIKTLAEQKLRLKGLLSIVNPTRLQEAINKSTGLPTQITN